MKTKENFLASKIIREFNSPHLHQKRSLEESRLLCFLLRASTNSCCATDALRIMFKAVMCKNEKIAPKFTRRKPGCLPGFVRLSKRVDMPMATTGSLMHNFTVIAQN